VRTDEQLEALRATFQRSVWASREPLAIEVDVETPVAGVVVRCRIDAVFPERAEPRPGEAVGRAGAVVVDWKTGRVPRDEESRRAREVQLAAYRLAWSRWSGLPLEDVSAAFYYVADDTIVRPVDLLDEAALEALVRGEALLRDGR
jgi:DNA helicase-2/ATP-dependent DNA helicase PcrA